MYAVIILHLVCAVLSVEEFSIIRKVFDEAHFPSSMVCTSVLSNRCNKMRGNLRRIGGECVCICGRAQNTLTHVNRTWICTRNDVLRDHAKCSILINGGFPGNLMSPILPIPAEVKITSFDFVVGALKIPNIDKTSKCVLVDCWFLDCYGTWKKMDNLINVFGILKLNDITDLLYLFSGTSFEVFSMVGRVVKVNIRCTNPSIINCVVLKVQGHLNCSVLMSNTSHHPTIITPTTTPTHADKYTDTSWPTIPISTKRRNEQENQENSKHSGLIAGFVLGAVALLLLVLVVMVNRGRSKRNFGVNTTSTTEDRTVTTDVKSDFDNCTYNERISGPDVTSTANEDHIYAYADNLPYLVTDIKDIKPPINHSHVVQTKERSHSEPLPEPGVVYETLEETVDHNQDRQDHCTAISNADKQEISNIDPIYNILDPNGTYSEYSPSEDTLVPHQYGPIISNKYNGNVNTGLCEDDDVNDDVTSVYQQLDFAGQSSPDKTYQPLIINKQVM